MNNVLTITVLEYFKGARQAMTSIIDQVVSKARSLIANQVKYVYPIQLQKDGAFDADAMESGAEKIADEEVTTRLVDQPIFFHENIEQLITKMGVSDLYDEDSWVDPIADYIVEHADDCMPTWLHIQKLGERND